MEFEQEDNLVPVSPSGQLLNSSLFSSTIVCVFEFDVPIDDLQIFSIVNDRFLPINPRFSSVMVEGKNCVKKWKQVEVQLKDHIIFPKFPEGKSSDFYDEKFNEYISKITVDQLSQSRPLWEIHLVAYPTSNAAGNLIFKLHHSLGDGYTLMGVVLTCLERCVNPSLPLTFPSLKSNSKQKNDANNFVECVPRAFSGIINSVLDFGLSFLKGNLLKDDRTPIRSGEDGVEFRPTAVTTITFSFDDIKQIKERLKVTVNDVITGIIFLGSRHYMEGEGKGSRKSNSTALVMLNTRNIGGYKSVSEMVKPDAEGSWGNYCAYLHVPIPKLTATNSSNPLSFVVKVNKIIKRQKNSVAVYLTGRLLETIRKYRGSEAAAKQIYRTLKNSSMAMSNLIGPVEQMALANFPIKGFYFMVAGAPMSLGISVVSYAGILKIAINAEKGFIDSQKFKSCIENAFDMMFKATLKSS